jgi:hypothetical protein
MHHTETYRTNSMMMIHQGSKNVGVSIVFNINNLCKRKKNVFFSCVFINLLLSMH